MITNPSKKYEKLFFDAYQLLQEKGKLSEESIAAEKFTSLEEYFMYIGDLAKIHHDCVRGTLAEGDKTTWNARFAQYSKYLMIPIDEDYFKINANTRTISVPSIFASSGVSLVGDQRAETLIFEIDRYFDFVDLLRTNIYAQWTNPDGEDGATLISLIDYDDKKIRFGWVLSENITKQGNGNLTFSIRFFMRDNITSLITYSLNTLPITVKIKPVLRIEVESTYTDEEPYLFTAAIVNGANSNTNVFPNQPIIYLQEPEEKKVYLDENNTCVFKIGAYSIDNGKISYVWKTVLNDSAETLNLNEEQNQELLGIITEVKYEKTSDLFPVDKKTYYTKENGGAYIPFVGISFDENEIYYEQFAYCTITNTSKQIIGKYNVSVINTVNKNTSISEGETWIIPGPKDITYINNLKENGNIIPIDTNSLELSVSVKLDDENASPSYQWYQKKNEQDEFEIIEGENERIYNATEAGWYRVKTTSTLNRASIELDSNISKVTFEPQPPTIIYKDQDGSGGNIVTVDFNTIESDTYALEVEVEEMNNILESEEIVYEWYHEFTDSNGERELAEVGKCGVVDISDNVLTVSYANKWEAFICKVTNKLNGKIAEAYSDKYIIVKY